MPLAYPAAAVRLAAACRSPHCPAPAPAGLHQHQHPSIESHLHGRVAGKALGAAPPHRHRVVAGRFLQARQRMRGRLELLWAQTRDARSQVLYRNNAANQERDAHTLSFGKPCLMQPRHCTSQQLRTCSSVATEIMFIRWSGPTSLPRILQQNRRPAASKKSCESGPVLGSRLGRAVAAV